MTAHVYRVFDAIGRLLYVGCSEHAIRRLTEHRIDKPWWADVADVRLTECPDRFSALDAEAEAIRTERPIYNVSVPRTYDKARGPIVLRVEKMRDYCLHHGISRDELARRTGLASTTLYRIEKGRVCPSSKFIANLLMLTGESFDDLFELTEDAEQVPA